MAMSVVKFHTNKSGTAISTDAPDEAAFLAAVLDPLAEEICREASPQIVGQGTRDAVSLSLETWLRQVVEIVCKLRGYKADVVERRVIVSGHFLPEDVVEVFAERP